MNFPDPNDIEIVCRRWKTAHVRPDPQTGLFAVFTGLRRDTLDGVRNRRTGWWETEAEAWKDMADSLRRK